MASQEKETKVEVAKRASNYLRGSIVEKRGVKASGIAHGVPLGGELEYVDGGTLSHAFYGRRAVD